MNKFKVEFIGDINEIDPTNGNIDVNIIFEDRSKFFGTFFTIGNIIELTNNYKKSGENLHGRYFWSTNMCIVSDLSLKTIEATISDLFEKELINDVFYKITD